MNQIPINFQTIFPPNDFRHYSIQPIQSHKTQHCTARKKNFFTSLSFLITAVLRTRIDINTTPRAQTPTKWSSSVVLLYVKSVVFPHSEFIFRSDGLTVGKARFGNSLAERGGSRVENSKVDFASISMPYFRPFIPGPSRGKVGPDSEKDGIGDGNRELFKFDTVCIIHARAVAGMRFGKNGALKVSENMKLNDVVERRLLNVWV